MFPIRDHNPSSRVPYVRNALLFLNIALWVLTSPWLFNFSGLWAWGALYPIAVTHGQMTWGLVTHMFLHAGTMHLAGNMLFLWVFGDNLEDMLGHGPFAAFYLIAGLAAAATQIMIAPGSTVPMVGASGAIAGVMGGYLLLFPRARVDLLVILIVIVRIIPVPAYFVLIVWFALQVWNGATTYGMTEGVAWFAHIGGFALGVIMTIPVWLRLGGPRYWQRTYGAPPHLPVDYTPSRLPVVRR